MKRFLVTAAAVVFASVAYAAPVVKTVDTTVGKVMADEKGMVLYIYDRDTTGAAASSCAGNCIVAWPPFLAPADAKAEGDWTVVNGTDKDGKAIKLWAYKGLPLYYYQRDTKAGDATGDGVGGVWHVVKM